MSIYKTFRNYRNTPTYFNTISPRFDQPTYLSFKLDFAPSRDRKFNGAAPGSGSIVNYDVMPHPLFGVKGNDNVDLRETYSAIDYLYDANEFTRARMLEEFIDKFNTLQSEFQWYFQKIDGVGDLLKINPANGMRITSDKRLIVTTLEGIDLRMSHIMNLYRKIAWDDTYQRWVLPDMMRYFSMNIYIAEFRAFHAPKPYDGYGQAISGKERDTDILELGRLDDILPTWVINCEMCEFDLENLEMNYLGNLGIADDPEAAGLSFGIKVGKIYEEQIYPTFYNTYLFDKLINGRDRAVDKFIDEDVDTNIFGDAANFNSTTKGDNNAAKPSVYTQVAQSESLTDDQVHVSGLPFNELKDSKALFGAQAGGPDGDLLTNDDNNFATINPTLPNTWFGNAVDFGKSFLKNEIKGIVDKAKVTTIPGLGVSFNEAQAALESKNIITALGMVRKATNAVAREYVQPSELLEGNIQNDLFKAYLKNIVASEATEDNQLIQEAANMALNDDGVWAQIKDYSMATDLVGQGELNAANPIEGGRNYENVTSEATQGDKSLATNLVGEGEQNIEVKIEVGTILEGVPTSKATTGEILKG